MPTSKLPLRCNAPSILLSLLAFTLLPDIAVAAPNDNCQMQISHPVIDYGEITRAELLERQITPSAFSLGKQTMTLSATCRQATFMTLYYRGAAGDANKYSFGNSGSFTLNTSMAQLDGKRVRLGNVRTPGQQPERIAESAVLSPGVGIVPVFDERPVRGTSFSVQIDIDTQIFTASSRITDRTVWRSSGSFELVEN